MGRKRARSPAGIDFSTCGRCSEGDSQEHSESDARNEERQDEEDEQNQEESQRDQEPSESDGDDESLDEEEQEMQIDQELAEADGDDEGAQDEEDEQEPLESDGDDESLGEEEQEMQIDQELEEADGDEEEENEQESEGDEEEENGAQDEEDEQVDQERQMHQESPEADGQEEENVQVVDNSDAGRVPESSSEPVLDPPPFKSTALVSMTLDENMLDCGICYFPLKPPIFQCSVGHVVCSSCRDKLAAEGRCHVCRTLIAGGYRRCHALEQLVDSILGSCPYGCAAPKMRHYELRDHLQACTHVCHCPARDCDFVGSTAALIHHLVDRHKWSCITGVKHNEVRVTHLHYGFNFMVVVHQGRDYIFLLRVVRLNGDRAISCLCVRPQAAVAADDSSPPPSKNVSCMVQLFHMPDFLKRSFILSICRAMSFELECTDLSNGMPNLRDCEHFMVFDHYNLPGPADTLKVNVTCAIGSSICPC